jgi:NAD(P)-dependent dehydrogenase (short-subunit alcohol dehydrogenase family)
MSVRVVVVTGGAYGIGRATVSEFARQGDRVVIADIHEERGVELASSIESAGGQALFVKTDVQSESEIKILMERAVTTFGRIDVLCSNAGIERYRKADQYSVEDWDTIHNTNLRAAFLCSRYAHPFLKAQRGSIVITASVQAVASEKHISAYTASKAGLLGLTRSMALDFGEDGIRVNAVLPGVIHTGMLEAFLKDHPDPNQALEQTAQSIPLGRVGQPEDVAKAIYFLASPAASYITGVSLTIDGGLLTRLAL